MPAAPPAPADSPAPATHVWSRASKRCCACRAVPTASAVQYRHGWAVRMHRRPAPALSTATSTCRGLPLEHGLYPAHLGLNAAIVMQVDTAVRRRTRVDRIAVTLRQELGARRRRPQQAHALAVAIVGLMNVTPRDPPNVGMCIDDPPEILRIGESDAIQPTTADVDGVMMQAHQRMSGG